MPNKETPYQRRNRRAREAGYRNYYQQRLARAEAKYGKEISRAQARGHPAKNEMSAPKHDKLRKEYVEKGREAVKRLAEREGWKLTHDQWSRIFGSPKLRNRSMTHLGTDNEE